MDSINEVVKVVTELSYANVNIFVVAPKRVWKYITGKLRRDDIASIDNVYHKVEYLSGTQVRFFEDYEAEKRLRGISAKRGDVIFIPVECQNPHTIMYRFQKAQVRDAYWG